MGLQWTRPHWFTDETMGRQACWFYDYISPHQTEYMALARRLSDSTRAARRIVSEAEVEMINCDHWEYITEPKRYMQRLVFDIAVCKLAGIQPSINHYVATHPVDAPQKAAPTPDRDRVLNALDRVPMLYRRTLLMRQVKGQSTTEIAHKFKLTPDKVRQRLAQARVIFCNALDAEATVPANACALTDGFFRARN